MNQLRYFGQVQVVQLAALGTPQCRTRRNEEECLSFCLDRCPHDPDMNKQQKMDGWMEGNATLGDILVQ